MNGLEYFLKIFGDLTLNKVIVFILAVIFCIGIYKQVKKFLDHKKQVLIEQHEVEKEKNEQIQKMFKEVNKYPEYREQSRTIQKEFRQEIDELKKSQINLAETQTIIQDTLKDMQERQDRREKNKLRDKLLQNYRYYTDLKRNPEQSWTSMESEAFWALFRDYEEAGGDGYMHTEVQPAMNLLKIVDN